MNNKAFVNPPNFKAAIELINQLKTEMIALSHASGPGNPLLWTAMERLLSVVESNM